MGENIAEEIVREIILDIQDRRGLGDEWNGIDGVTQIDIAREWEAIVAKHMDKINAKDGDGTNPD